MCTTYNIVSLFQPRFSQPRSSGSWKYAFISGNGFAGRCMYVVRTYIRSYMMVLGSVCLIASVYPGRHKSLSQLRTIFVPDSCCHMQYCRHGWGACLYRAYAVWVYAATALTFSLLQPRSKPQSLATGIVVVFLSATENDACIPKMRFFLYLYILLPHRIITTMLHMLSILLFCDGTHAPTHVRSHTIHIISKRYYNEHWPLQSSQHPPKLLMCVRIYTFRLSP